MNAPPCDANARPIGAAVAYLTRSGFPAYTRCIGPDADTVTIVLATPADPGDYPRWVYTPHRFRCHTYHGRRMAVRQTTSHPLGFTVGVWRAAGYTIRAACDELEDSSDG